MYTGLIQLFVIFIAILITFMNNKMGCFQSFSFWLRKKSFFHKAPSIHVRFYLKIFLPHFWCWKAYKVKNYKKYPTFYSVLNGIQFIGILGSFAILIVIQLGVIKLSEVKQNGGVNAHVFLIEATEPRLAKNEKYYPAELRVLFDNQDSMVFKLSRGLFQDDEIDFKSIKEQLEKKVFIEYFTVFMGQNYLISLKSKKNIVIPREKSISGYRDQETSISMVVWMFIIGCVAALWKYKLYGFRNYFNKLTKERNNE